jgi:hypothetical protein
MTERTEQVFLYGSREENQKNRAEIKKWLTGTRLCLRCGHMYVNTEPKICDCKNPFTVPGELVFEDSVNDLRARFHHDMQSGTTKHIYQT